MLSKRLKEARNALKLTQEQLGEKVNTTKGTISNYENGHSTPSNDMLVLLAEKLNTTPNQLLGVSEYQNSETISVAGKEINFSPEELEVLKEIKKHPNLFHELASNPEKKVKELIKLYTMKKMFLEDDDEETGDGFGSLKD